MRHPTGFPTSHHKKKNIIKKTKVRLSRQTPHSSPQHVRRHSVNCGGFFLFQTLGGRALFCFTEHLQMSLKLLMSSCFSLSSFSLSPSGSSCRLVYGFLYSGWKMPLLPLALSFRYTGTVNITLHLTRIPITDLQVASLVFK